MISQIIATLFCEYTSSISIQHCDHIAAIEEDEKAQKVTIREGFRYPGHGIGLLVEEGNPKIPSVRELRVWGTLLPDEFCS